MSISVTRTTITTPHPMRRAGDFVVGTSDAVGGGSAALTPTEPVQRAAPASSHAARPNASFVAHLIATAEQDPQTRALRRADVADVETAYRAAAGYGAAGPTGRGMQRII